ncbi:MAG: hypothetical protein WBE81_25980 [Pseudolabrys sp.]
MPAFAGEAGANSHAGLFLYFVAIAYNKPAICFFNYCKTDALNPAPCSLWQIAAVSFGQSVAGAIV